MKRICHRVKKCQSAVLFLEKFCPAFTRARQGEHIPMEEVLRASPNLELLDVANQRQVDLETYLGPHGQLLVVDCSSPMANGEHDDLCSWSN